MKIAIKILPLVLFSILSCKPTRTFLASEKVNYYRIKPADSLALDPSVEAMIQPYRAKLEGQMNEVIGTAAKELKKGQPVSTLGTWAAELILNQSIKYYGKDIDFATINEGGLRVRSLPKGKITRGTVYELMPFDNELVVLTTDSAGIDRFIRHTGSRGGWPIAGASYAIHSGKVEIIKIKGQLLRGGRTYTFVLSDYIANGGDNCDFLKLMKRENLNKLMRDTFMEGIISDTKQGKLLDADIDERVLIIND